MTDDYTLAMRLCDDEGQVSSKLVDAEGEPGGDRTYLDRLNRLRRWGAFARGESIDDITESFACTGSAHLAGEHIRCTSRAHR